MAKEIKLGAPALISGSENSQASLSVQTMLRCRELTLAEGATEEGSMNTALRLLAQRKNELATQEDSQSMTKIHIEGNGSVDDYSISYDGIGQLADEISEGADVTLNGKIDVKSASPSKVDTVNTAFPNTITTDDEYIQFEDRKVIDVFKEKLGQYVDEGGIKDSVAKTIKTLPTQMFKESEIETFDEFEEFTGITSFPSQESTETSGLFYGCKKLKSVVLPPTLKSLPNNNFGSGNYGGAFRDCISLESVRGENITNLGNSSFRNCSSLINVYLPKVTTLQNRVFDNCTSLMHISFPLLTNTKNSFFNCTSLQNVNLPSATSIDGFAFRSCISLQEVNAPLATTLGNNAFEECMSLTSIDLPLVTTLGGYAFINCTSLLDINFPLATKIDGNDTFRNCTSL